MKNKTNIKRLSVNEILKVFDDLYKTDSPLLTNKVIDILTEDVRMTPDGIFLTDSYILDPGLHSPRTVVDSLMDSYYNDEPRFGSICAIINYMYINNIEVEDWEIYDVAVMFDLCYILYTYIPRRIKFGARENKISVESVRGIFEIRHMGYRCIFEGSDDDDAADLALSYLPALEEVIAALSDFKWSRILFE